MERQDGPVAGARFNRPLDLAFEKGNLFVTGLRQGGIPRTGQVQRIVFNDRWEELRREPMLTSLQQRIRDIRQGPDGLLYLLTAEDDGGLLRLEPKQ